MKYSVLMGAVAGDVIGSVYEFNNHRSTDFNVFDPGSFFTDDTVLTIAVADAILKNSDLVENIKRWGRKYPKSGYGLRFWNWLQSEQTEPYNSWGNGSAMRVSPVGFAFNSLEEVLIQAEWSAEVTHNHPEGIKGAQAVAAAIYMARTGGSKKEIRDYIIKQFDYDLDRTCDEIRPVYLFNESCQETVPEAIIAFLESSDFENAIRLAVSLGGDSDTLACITGSIAIAFYKQMDDQLFEFLRGKLPYEMLEVVDEFDKKFSDE